MVASLQSKAPETLFEQSARSRMQAVLAESPDWLQDFRLKALSRFDALGIPSRRNEAWKYINIRPLLGMSFPPESTEPRVCPPALQFHLLGQTAQNDVKEQEATGQDAAQDVRRLVFVNGRFDPGRSSEVQTADGMVIESIRAAWQKHPELVRQHLGQYLDAESDPFAVLNGALFEDGLFVYLPENAEFKPLLQVIFVSFGEEPHTASPRNLIVLGRNARIEMVVEHLGLSRPAMFHNSVNEFLLDEGAQAECTLVLSEGPQGWHFAASRNVLQAGAKLNLSTVTLGGQVNRHTVQTLLKGEQAAVHLNGLDVLEHQTEIYHHTVTEHWVPHGVSDQFYKGILDDASKSEFNSLVFVAQDAVGTDSHQLNKNLLLSEEARVFTRPQLQINADDVKCAHGAAVGQLDEDQLFYLASRGLDRELAQSLLTYGFAEDIINRIANPLVRQYLDNRVLANLHSSNDQFKQQLGAYA